MEKIVEGIWPSCSSKPGQKSTNTAGAASQTAAPEEPDYEPGLKVPMSVLNECSESFLAADANRIKASTLFFFRYWAYGSVVLS